jgi:hypothetical protein
MSDKYLYRDIQTADRGRGYVAIEILARLAYLQAFVGFGWTLWTLGHASVDFNAIFTGLVSLLELAVTCLVVYVARLALRAVFVSRDSTAHEVIDQDARYKTSSST